jgi:transposase-like protein
VKERGVPVDHAAINHWVLKYSVQLEEVFHRRKYPVWISWRTDKTDIHPRQTGVVVFVSRGRLPWLSD